MNIEMPSSELIRGVYSGDLMPNEAFRRALIWDGCDMAQAMDKAHKIANGEWRMHLDEGDVFVTLSGHLTTPYPKATYKSHKRNQKATATWLKENAIREAERRPNDTIMEIWLGLDPDNWTTSDSEVSNQFLFGSDYFDGRIGSRRANLGYEPKAENKLVA